MKINVTVLVVLMGLCGVSVAEVEYVPIDDKDISAESCSKDDKDCDLSIVTIQEEDLRN